MPSFENNIMGLVPKEEWLDVGFDVSRPNDPIANLYTDETSDNLVSRYQTIMSEYQIPVAADFHAFDTQANTTFRIPIDVHSIEKGLIKVKINQSERMRTLLRAGVQNDDMYDYVINDAIRLADQVNTRALVAKYEVLYKGKMTIRENNLDLTIDYGVPFANTNFTFDVSKDADIIGQLQKILDIAREQGVILTGVITSSSVLTKMRTNSSIQEAINGTSGEGITVRNTALRDFLNEEFGLTNIITADNIYGDDYSIGADGRPSVKSKRYYPKDKITFFSTTPAGRIGAGLWGVPPEGDAGDYYSLGSTGQNPYIYIMQWMTQDPAVLWTKASALFIPVLFNPNGLYIATVVDKTGEISPDILAPIAQDKEVGLGSVKARDLITGETRVMGDGKVIGTLKYKDGFTDFSSNTADQKGNYFPFVLGSDYEGKEITVKKNSGTAKTATDTVWVLKVTQNDKFAFYEGTQHENGTPIITLDFSEANLEKENGKK